jgi:hypothetical protein
VLSENHHLYIRGKTWTSDKRAMCVSACAGGGRSIDPNVEQMVAHLALTSVEMTWPGLAHEFGAYLLEETQHLQCSATSIGSIMREGSMTATRTESNSGSGDALLASVTARSTFVATCSRVSGSDAKHVREATSQNRYAYRVTEQSKLERQPDYLPRLPLDVRDNIAGDLFQ